MDNDVPVGLHSQGINTQVVNSVGIVGCGWLGKALANKLQVLNIPVMATRSTVVNVAELSAQGIDTKLLSLPTEQEELNSHEIFTNQCLVIAITPQLRQGRVDYAHKVYQLILAAKQSRDVEKVILLSSTAVYNGLTGVVAEKTELNHKAEKVAVLSQAEQVTLRFNISDSVYETNHPDDRDPSRAYVLRLSGLVGPNRHPGKFLMNGRQINNSQATVNLIHQEDAVGLILSMLSSDLSGGIFNGVSETKVSKQEYYQAAAQALQLESPQFDDNESDGANAKVVSGEKTQRMLKYEFVYPDLLDWLSHCDKSGAIESA